MTRVHRKGLRGAALCLALVAGGTLAGADEPAAAPAAEPKVQVTGFVDAYYGYNFNQTAPGLRTFDVQHDAFSLSLAEVAFTKAPVAGSPVGFRVDLDYGKTASLVSAFEPDAGDRALYENVQQAYVSALAGKLQVDAGKFVTPIGTEVIESQDNWNYTRSILFGYAIPFYHVGLRASLPVGDKVTLAAYAVNGWNNGTNLDGGKTLGLGATLKPSAKLTWVLNYMGGSEADGLDTRHLFDTTATLAITDKLSVMGNFDYGKEGGASWWGVAGYARLQATPTAAIAARYEYLDDTDGAFMTFGTKAQSFTLTGERVIAGALKARIDFRTDLADEDIFTKDGSPKGSQASVTVGVVYSFGAGLF